MQLKTITYKHSGVHIDLAQKLIDSLKPEIQKTNRPGVLSSIGGFGALFELNLKKYKNPILVSSTDGVGTKLKLSIQFQNYKTIGQDLVAMNVNDILTLGAEPLFFLDYFATSKLHLKRDRDILLGIAKGCKIAGSALIGGETAEMPGLYRNQDYDLAGFTVGVVEKNKIIDGKKIRSGHQLIGLASSGLHSNGFSLVRKVLSQKDLSKWKTQLLTPTKIYVPVVLPLLKKFPIHGMAHITGGGLTDNIPRVLPKGLHLHIDDTAWPMPAIFKMLQHKAHLSQKEMFRTFNCGIGYVLIVPKHAVNAILKALQSKKQKAWVIGEVQHA
ncbi:MAG: phosphoribosylformylglycinamidine cyclo-ligase [Deltaproteobacteria bacterium RIFCSPHIGHO2_02_FULL_40_11]|nr:MAG: phosphoribosylformylglycinamidine cyclo-ligase [Deltaproteobacteria bacterium RIFCSPHIGHO2_02_FULL_40_11]